MGTYYKQLDIMDRVHLQHMLEKGMRKSEIAKLLGFDVSTIYREIQRNIHMFRGNTTVNNKYYAYHHSFAQDKANNRRYKTPRKLDLDKDLREYVLKKLQQFWSPKQIEGRLKLENKLNNVTHETIYQYIYRKCHNRYRYSKYFRRKRINRLSRCSRRNRIIPEELLIRNRPIEILKRESIGHWECDLMMFSQGTKCNLITLRERKTRYLIAIKNNNKKALETAMNIIRRLKQFSSDYVKSITFDQGSEFLRYDWLTKILGVDVYFCNPASPHQKGAVENANSLLRVHL